MAKRFHSTELWMEDWFLEMPPEYKLFWFYMLSKCDHAGMFRVNSKAFSLMNTGLNVNTDQALEYFNSGKKRIRKVNGSMWLVEDFFVFQYGNKLNVNSTVHKSIKDIYDKNEVDLKSVRGLKEVKG